MRCDNKWMLEYSKGQFVTRLQFRVTCLFAGQYNTKGYGTITDVIYPVNTTYNYFKFPQRNSKCPKRSV